MCQCKISSLGMLESVGQDRRQSKSSCRNMVFSAGSIKALSSTPCRLSRPCSGCSQDAESIETAAVACRVKKAERGACSVSRLVYLGLATLWMAFWGGMLHGRGMTLQIVNKLVEVSQLTKIHHLQAGIKRTSL